MVVKVELWRRTIARAEVEGRARRSFLVGRWSSRFWRQAR